MVHGLPKDRACTTRFNMVPNTDQPGSQGSGSSAVYSPQENQKLKFLLF